MENRTKQLSDVEPISVMEDDYRYPSCEFPRTITNNSETIDYTRYNSSKSRNKKVKFNQKVTIVNIQSHKKFSKMQSYQDYNSNIDEEINEEKEKKCVNCNIF